MKDCTNASRFYNWKESPGNELQFCCKSYFRFEYHSLAYYIHIMFVSIRSYVFSYKRALNSTCIAVVLHECSNANLNVFAIGGAWGNYFAQGSRSRIWFEISPLRGLDFT